MALLTQASAIQLATMIPEETSDTAHQSSDSDCAQEASGVGALPDNNSATFVPDQPPISDGDATQCTSEAEPINNEGDSTVCGTTSDIISSSDVGEPPPPHSTSDISSVENLSLPTSITESSVDPVMGQAPGNINVFGYSNYVTTPLPGVDSLGVNGVPQAFHSLYVQYTSGAVPQPMYPTNDLSYPMYVVGRPPVCAPNPNSFFFDNSNSAVCNAVASIPPPDPEPKQPWSCDAGSLPTPDLEPDPEPDPDADQEAEDLITAQRLGRQSTVQWLLQNYETAEGESLRRSTLYNHYLRHCKEQNIDSVNAASFGKLIRSVFLGLRTRRLGTRGNSKYHYYGIRIKPGSRLNYVPDNDLVSSRLSSAANTQPQPKTVSQDCNPFLTSLNECRIDNSEEHVDCDSDNPLQYPIHHDGLSCVEDIPELPCIDWPPECVLPLCCTSADVELLRDTYRKHCEDLREAALHLDVRAIEGEWKNFWKIRDNVTEKSINGKRLSAIKMYVLSTCVPVQLFIRNTDYMFYQYLVDAIIPDVLRPMSRSLIRSVRCFADELTALLKSSLVAWPFELIKIKVSAVSAFARTLYRYTSLNHIAQSVSSTIEDQSNLHQMMDDLSKVDFRDIQERAFWVCHGESETLHQFNVALQNQPPSSVQECVSNLTNFVTRMLKPYQGRCDFEKIARQFLLQWTYYSSLFMGYLTLKNASSFGSFHLIRLLSDEYVYYLVVHYVALETRETPVAVIGENSDKIIYGLNDPVTMHESKAIK